ncbi:uncharacterized protein LOC142099314 [Mixophyes fleayi]|uniref:uncharacterized protein LOC142099314 n=1 Tax=Mixophyes fleayi TaxID=3061075 RepID=UPI003F4DACA0
MPPGFNLVPFPGQVLSTNSGAVGTGVNLQGSSPAVDMSCHSVLQGMPGGECVSADGRVESGPQGGTSTSHGTREASPASRQEAASSDCRTGLQDLAVRSLAPSTRRVYQAAWQQWCRFLESKGRQDGGQKEDIDAFIWERFKEGLSKAAMSSMLAGISFMARLYGFNEVTKGFLISRAMRGWAREQPSVEDHRRPIETSLLRQLIVALASVTKSDYETLLFSTAFSLAFFGAFRVSELVSPSKHVIGNALMARHVLLAHNVLSCKILRSKTDQMSKGYWMSIKAHEDQSICAFMLCSRLEGVRPSGSEPWLIHADGAPLTKFQFNAVLKATLKHVGLNPELYGTHSFRIGAATAAAGRGASISAIKSIGRWKSDVYKKYVRPELG